MEFPAGDVVWCGQRQQHLLGTERRILRVFDLCKQNHEFVAPLAAHGVRIAQASQQTLRNRLQEFVADRVSERIVDVFEAIQIQKQHGVMLAVATGQGNCVLHAVAQQRPVRQIGEKIMPGQMRHPFPGLARGAYIVEHDYRARDVTCAVVDRGSRIFDDGFKTVAAQENAVRGQPHGLVFFNGQCHRIGRDCACGAVDNPKYIGKGTPRSILAGPTRHGLRDCIEVGDVARDVGAEYGVADGIERDLRALPFHEKRLLPRLALDHAAQSPRQPVVVEMFLEQVILRATLCGLRGDGFVFPGGQDQGRNQRGHREECLERLDTLTIRQEQIEQDRGNSRLAQSAHAVAEPPDPFQTPFVFGCRSQCVANQAGIGGVFRDKEHGERFVVHGYGIWTGLFDSKAPAKGLAWQSGASATARSVRQPT